MQECHSSRSSPLLELRGLLTIITQRTLAHLLSPALRYVILYRRFLLSSRRALHAQGSHLPGARETRSKGSGGAQLGTSQKGDVLSHVVT